MKIGVIGSGLIGSKLGTLLARVGHDVVFSYSRSSAKLKKLARQAGDKARAGTPREAAQDADVVMLAVHWNRVDDVLSQVGLRVLDHSQRGAVRRVRGAGSRQPPQLGLLRRRRKRKGNRGAIDR